MEALSINNSNLASHSQAHSILNLQDSAKLQGNSST
jgi:hypothetical protein